MKLTVAVAAALLVLQAASPVAATIKCADSKCTSCPDSFLTCDACQSGYSPVDFTGSWGIGLSVKSCIPVNNQGCSVAHCSSCPADDVTKCSGCADGYSLYSPDYMQGHSLCLDNKDCIVAGCSQCDGKPWSCRTCSNGSTPNKYGACSIETSVCTATNCAKCQSSDITQCTTCKQGYDLRDGKCYGNGQTQRPEGAAAQAGTVAAAAFLAAAALIAL